MIAGLWRRAKVAFALMGIMACTGSCASQNIPPLAEHWKWGTIEESEENDRVFDAVKTAMRNDDIAALDALERQYRDPKALTPSGMPQLSIYYKQLGYEVTQLGRDDQTCTYGRTNFLDRWRSAFPNSPVPFILAAELADTRAWCFRGSGAAANVSSDAWRPFNENISAGIDLLEKHKTIASQDPEYYATLISLQTPAAPPYKQFVKLLDEASSRFPYYYNIYYSSHQYFQPQWYGSLADLDAMARYTAQMTSRRDGTSGYFRYYWHILLCGCYSELRAADWPTMQVAMADLAARYPVDWTYLHLVQMACQLGQRDEAKKYFARMTVNQARSWKRDEWERCRALVGPSPEPFPEN